MAQDRFATLVLENEVINDHKINLKDTLEINVNYLNNGNSPLVITKIEAHCTCTTTQFQKTPLMPGKKSKINVRIIPNSKGRFIKELYIFSNSTNSPTLLRIKANVK